MGYIQAKFIGCEQAYLQPNNQRRPTLGNISLIGRLKLPLAQHLTEKEHHVLAKNYGQSWFSRPSTHQAQKTPQDSILRSLTSPIKPIF